MRNHIRKIVVVIILCLLTPTVWAQGLSIASVSPNIATAEDTNVSVTATLSGNQFPPIMDTLMIGSLTGSNMSYDDSAGTITAQFDFSSASVGSYDVVVQFSTPDGTQTITLTDGFTIQRTGGAAIIYVDTDSSAGTPDGTTWATAYPDLQTALSNAISGDEIWVAEGTYYPTSGSDRTVSFELVSDVAIYGGFAGTETDRVERDPNTNVSILSGDIGTANVDTDNSYHVLVGADSATLDGLTITKGYADGADGNTRHEKGGGMINYNADGYGVSPILNNVIFDDNYAKEGGAMYNYGRTETNGTYDIQVLITGGEFKNNSAKRGGAILARVAGNTYLTNTTFTNNEAEWRGGALYIDYGTTANEDDYTPTITGVTFTSNNSNGHGGAVYVDDWSSQVGYTTPLFDNCTFINNSATYFGGAIRAYNKGNPKIQNSTFTNNSANAGGDISIDYGSTVTLSNNSYTSGNADIDTGTGGHCSGDDCP